MEMLGGPFLNLTTMVIADERTERPRTPAPVTANYYIAKGQKTVGPCSLDDLRSYIAYGSVRDNDLVRREGAADWTPLRYLHELKPQEGETITAQDITTRRRIARYRDYDKVPVGRRAGVVFGRLFWGFMIFPPLLWRGAVAVFQDRIYRTKKDAHGYLIPWPRWVEVLVSVLIVLNALLWWVGLWWITNQSAPLAKELSAMVTTAITELQDWLTRR